MLSRCSCSKWVKRCYRGQQLIAPVANQRPKLLDLAMANQTVDTAFNTGDVRDVINASVANLSPIGSSSQSVGAVGDRTGGLRERVNVNANVNMLVGQFQLDLNRMIKTYGEKEINHLVDLPLETLVERIGELMIAFDIADSSLIGHLILHNPMLLGTSTDETDHIVTRWKQVNKTLHKFISSINEEHTRVKPRKRINEKEGIRLMIKKAPLLLNVHSKGIHARMRYFLDDERRWPMLDGKRRQMLLAIYDEPSVLVELGVYGEGDRRLQLFDQYGFSSHKINDIFTHNPKVFSSLYADHESTAENPVSDLDARLFFLIKECDFTTNEIVKFPLLLTMDFYLLKGRYNCSIKFLL